MTIDFSNISLMTQAEIVNTCHINTAVPAALITYVTFIIFSLGIGFIFASKSKGKIMTIIGLASLFTGIVLLFILMSPNFTQMVVTFFQRMV